jgi:predicted metalloprotease with PDZ domain
MALSQQPAIHYSLGMSQPSTHLLEVEVRCENIRGGAETIDFILPVWRPGRYVVLDFAGGIQSFSASDGDDKPLSWSKTDKATWRVTAGKANAVTIRYKVYANEFNMRTRGLNDEHAFVDGSAVFMYAERFRALPLQLTVQPFGSWHVTTGLEGSGKEFAAPNYDYFVDCPLEIGNQKDFPFTVEGVPHLLSIYGEGNWNPDTLTHDIVRIVTAQKNFWGQFPYKRYVFLLHCTNSGGGGTEHINSTIMGFRPYGFKNPDSYRGFLGLVSHEFFHTWNVKQLRPKGIHPYDFTKENYTQELWIAEGTTSYFDQLILVRTGFTQADKYLEQIAGGVQGDRQRPGNAAQSVADASFDAWVKYWKGGEQSNNFESDYYDKGSMASLLLDLDIRQRTQNARSLDDVMRAMYNRYPLSGPGYTLADFQKASEEAAGESLKKFFDDYVYGTAPLPWEEYLLRAGLLLAPKDSVQKTWLGVGTSDVGDKTRVTRVTAGSPGYAAGLDIGDEILALDGSRVRTGDLNDRVGERKPGDKVTLTVFHNDRLKEVRVTLASSPVPAYKLTKIPAPTSMQKSIYESWLKTGW